MPFSVSGITFRGDLADFTGGLNNFAHNTLVRENQASDIQNMVFSSYGPIATRWGYEELNGTVISNNPIVGLAEYVEYDGTRNFLSICGTKLYKLSGSTWGEAGTGLTDGKFGSMVNVGGKMYIANGEENLQVYDGSTMAETAQYPASPCSYLISIHSPPRIFALRGKDYISRYYWCDPGEYETWGIDAFEELPNGDEIMGGAVLFGRPIIFGRNSIFMIIGTDPTTWELRQVNSAVGLVAPRSIAYVQGELWFAARDGVYALGGTSSDSGSVYSFDNIGVRKVSVNIQGTWDTINQDAIYKCAAGVLNNKYELSVPIDPATDNDTTLYCDTNIRNADMYGRVEYPWSVFTYGFNIFASYQSGNVPYLYAGETLLGTVHKLRTGTNDNGTAISWFYRTKYFDAGIREFNKAFEEMFVWTEESGDWNMTLGYTIDFQGDSGGYSTANLNLSSSEAGWGTMIWGVDKWHESADAKVFKRYFNDGDYGFTPYAGQELKTRGRYMRLSFSGSTKDQYATIIGLILKGRITDEGTTAP